MQIRKAEKADLEDILAIYKKARAFMAANGNPTQWGKTKPPKEQIEDDIEKGKSYVCFSEMCLIARKVGKNSRFCEADFD